MASKKVCMITLGNLYLCPYKSKYTSIIGDNIDIIYWNRHGLEESFDNGETYSFDYLMNEDAGKLNKIIGYFKFARFAKKVINHNDYDGLILLQSILGILLFPTITRKFSFRYILDIRDYTLENNKIYKFFLQKVINKSFITAISSKGYENFLPKNDYVIVHNDTNIDPEVRAKFISKEHSDDQIVISYIGLIRFHEQNKKVIMKFKNDKRFKLKFIGKGAFTLRDFCNENKVNNVELIDWFPSSDTLGYYYKTNLIYNLYGNNSPFLDYALSNKLYYAAQLSIPILVCPDTYMAKITSEYGLGFIFDINDPKVCDQLYSYYKSIDWVKFQSNCEKFMQKVEIENKIFNNEVNRFYESLSENK